MTSRPDPGAFGAFVWLFFSTIAIVAATAGVVLGRLDLIGFGLVFASVVN